MDPQTVALIWATGHALKPYLPYVVGTLLLYIIIKFIGEPIESVVRLLTKEFGELLKGNYNEKSLNALAIIISAALIVVFFAIEPFKHILLPEINKAGGDVAELMLKGFYAAIVFLFFTFSLICIKLTKS